MYTMSSSNFLTIVSSHLTMVDESTQTTPSTESDVLDEREVLPWTADEEIVINKANKNMDKYVREQDRIERHEEKVRRILEQNKQDEQCIDAEKRTIARQTLPSPSHSPSPSPLFHKGTPGVIFPDRETYLMTPVSYLIGLIEGTPNNEFVSGPT